MRKAIMAATMIAAFVPLTFAAGEYYVVQDVRTKKCTVIDRKPHRLIEAVRECRRDRLQDTLGSGERHKSKRCLPCRRCVCVILLRLYRTLSVEMSVLDDFGGLASPDTLTWPDT